MLISIKIILFQVNGAFLDKKTIDGMILKTLWTKAYKGFDVAAKEQAIKKLKTTGEYDKLINHLLKVKKENVQKLLNLFSEIIIIYMTN